MNRTLKTFRTGFLLLAMLLATVLTAGRALADKLYLKDGRVLEGVVVREGTGFIYFKVKVGTVASEQLFTTDQILKIERDDPAPKTDEALQAKQEQEKKAAAEKKDKFSRVPRIAILDFGAPASWKGEIGDMVGSQIRAEAFRQAIPMLKKDGVNVVVIRINSGGGAGSEVELFHKLFQNEYKQNFRLVGWVESAISAAAMSPYVIEEFYFMPHGNLGACTGWYGNLNNVEGVQLEMMLAQMEDASRLGKRDPLIMRAMQIQMPLSATIDPHTGEVAWFPDTSGEIQVNPATGILTLTANEAVKLKFARGIAATPDELAKAMGLQEYEFGGKEAADFIDKSMREADKSEKRFEEVVQKYQLAVGLAQQLQGDANKKKRGEQIALARRHLAELRRLYDANPFHGRSIGASPEWFQQQEEMLRKLA